MKISLWSPVLLMLLGADVCHAGSATWNLNPTSGDWNSAANWTPATVPNGPADVATFGVSDTTNLTMSAGAVVGSIVFLPGASAYTIDTAAVGFKDYGSVQNNSGVVQNVIGTEVINFEGAGSDAGDLMAYTLTEGQIDFFGGSAGSSTLTINGGGNSNIDFQINATAADSTVICNDGSAVFFEPNASAGNATLIMNDGALRFSYKCDGGTARAELLGTSSMDISPHKVPGMNIGSIEGSGPVFLGGNSLTVGGNNLSTIYSGTLQDGGGSGGTGGSLVKAGKGKLMLTGGNSSYTGGTTIKQGALLVTNRTGSATGTGAITVQGGIFGGTGKITGAVSVGVGTTGGTLAPGNGNTPGTLTTKGALTFNSAATYKVDLNSIKAATDSIVAMGVTVNSGARISIRDLGSATLTAGTVFTIIKNTAATPIAGTFGNLADGSTLVVGGNTYLVSYSGGDGNDLTLTVVP